METQKVETISGSSVLSREQILKAAIDDSAEALLMIIKYTGENSREYIIAEMFLDLIKKEYEFLVTKREYNDMCQQHYMRFGLEGLEEIITLGRMLTDMQKFASILERKEAN